MSKKIGQETAFPSVSDISHDEYRTIISGTNGMSKRFYAACMAMQGLIANAPNGQLHNSSEGCALAYQWADELLKQEKKA